jgi:hypothetical protein
MGGWATIYENDWAVPANAGLGTVAYAAYQTNAVNVADPTYWFPVPESVLTNRMIFNVDPAQTNVFYQLNYLAQ